MALRVCPGGYYWASALDRGSTAVRGGLAAYPWAPGAAQLGVCDAWSLECASPGEMTRRRGDTATRRRMLLSCPRVPTSPCPRVSLVRMQAFKAESHAIVSRWSRAADAAKHAGRDQYRLRSDPLVRESGTFAARRQCHAARFRPPDAPSGSRQTPASAVRHLCEEHRTWRFWQVSPQPPTSHRAHLGTPARHRRTRGRSHVHERPDRCAHWSVLGSAPGRRPGQRGAGLCGAGTIAPAILARAHAHPRLWCHIRSAAGRRPRWFPASPASRLYARLFYLCRHHAPDALQHAGGTGVGLHQIRPTQGTPRADRALETRLEERLAAGDHLRSAALCAISGWRCRDRDRVRLAGPGTAHSGEHHDPRLPYRAGRRAGVERALPHRESAGGHALQLAQPENPLSQHSGLNRATADTA